VIKTANILSSENAPLDGEGGSSTFLNNELDTSENTSEDSGLPDNVHQTTIGLDTAKPGS
jgi:hypothetical protein